MRGKMKERRNKEIGQDIIIEDIRKVRTQKKP